MKKITLVMMVALFAVATSFGALIERSWSGQLFTIATTTTDTGDALTTSGGVGNLVEISVDGGSSFSAILRLHLLMGWWFVL